MVEAVFAADISMLVLNTGDDRCATFFSAILTAAPERCGYTNAGHFRISDLIGASQQLDKGGMVLGSWKTIPMRRIADIRPRLAAD